MNLALLIAALVCFIVAAITGHIATAPGWTRTGWGWIGAALLTVTLLIPALH